MEYNKENYEGRRIWLFPNDTYMKKGIIKDVDDLLIYQIGEGYGRLL